METKQEKSVKFLHGLRFTAIDIDGVAHRLEGVEADAQRKNDAKERVPLPAFQAKRLRQGVIAIDAKIEVSLKNRGPTGSGLRIARSPASASCFRPAPRSSTATGSCAARQMFQPLCGNNETDQPIEQRCSKHQRDEARLRPSVKCVSEDDQNEIAPTLRRSKKGVIDQQRQRRK